MKLYNSIYRRITETDNNCFAFVHDYERYHLKFENSRFFLYEADTGTLLGRITQLEAKNIIKSKINR